MRGRLLIFSRGHAAAIETRRRSSGLRGRSGRRAQDPSVHGGSAVRSGNVPSGVSSRYRRSMVSCGVRAHTPVCRRKWEDGPASVEPYARTSGVPAYRHQSGSCIGIPSGARIMAGGRRARSFRGSWLSRVSMRSSSRIAYVEQGVASECALATAKRSAASDRKAQALESLRAHPDHTAQKLGEDLGRFPTSSPTAHSPASGRRARCAGRLEQTRSMGRAEWMRRRGLSPMGFPLVVLEIGRVSVSYRRIRMTRRGALSHVRIRGIHRGRLRHRDEPGHREGHGRPHHPSRAR